LWACERDLCALLREVGENCHALGQHLQQAATHEQRLLRATDRFLDAQGARFEDGHERRVPREHAELTLCPGRDDELDVALEQAAFDAYHTQGKLHSFFFIASACARASSIVPTM